MLLQSFKAFSEIDGVLLQFLKSEFNSVSFLFNCASTSRFPSIVLMEVRIERNIDCNAMFFNFAMWNFNNVLIILGVMKLFN